MDAFCEHLVKRKKSFSDKLKIAAIIAAGVLFTVVALIIIFPIISRLFSSLAPLVFPLIIIAWYLVFSFTKAYSVEFEYAITNGEIDVDKIINQSKRAKVLSNRLRNFEIIAPVLSDKYTADFKNMRSFDCSSNSGNSATYFAVYSDDDGKKCLLFDPTDKMLDIIEKYCSDKFFRA